MGHIVEEILTTDRMDRGTFSGEMNKHTTLMTLH